MRVSELWVTTSSRPRPSVCRANNLSHRGSFPLIVCQPRALPPLSGSTCICLLTTDTNEHLRQLVRLWEQPPAGSWPERVLSNTAWPVPCWSLSGSVGNSPLTSTRGQLMTDWEKCQGGYTWGTRRKNDSGALLYDFKNRAAGEGASFKEKGKSGFRHVKVSHGLIPGVADIWEGLGVPVRLLPWGLRNLRYCQLR